MKEIRCLVAIIAVTALAGCADETCDRDDPSYQPDIDPARFVQGVDHPLMPLVPGTRWVFEGEGEHIEVEVLEETRVVMGVECVVVRDTVTEGGELIEDTWDWYAQDVDGNVWYMGEDSGEYEGGELVTTAGSWEGGVDGARPGILMPADPHVGDVFRQEFYPCEAEDMGEVISLDESVTVPYGTFDGCLQTRDYTPLEPDQNEYKYHCPGVWTVLETDVGTGERLVELIDMTTP